MAAARRAWRVETGRIAPERLVFLGECGVLTNMARLWGRSPRGTRAYGTAPCGRWTRLTVLGALGTGGVAAAMAVEAATSAARRLRCERAWAASADRSRLRVSSSTLAPSVASVPVPRPWFHSAPVENFAEAHPRARRTRALRVRLSATEPACMRMA